MSETVPSNRLRRPSLSPRWPHTTAPSGRAASPTPKLASDASSADVASITGKNSLGSSVAASAP
jgi:hypothetical protein